jgi:hypothetical protein
MCKFNAHPRTVHAPTGALCGFGCPWRPFRATPLSMSNILIPLATAATLCSWIVGSALDAAFMSSVLDAAVRPTGAVTLLAWPIRSRSSASEWLSTPVPLCRIYPQRALAASALSWKRRSPPCQAEAPSVRLRGRQSLLERRVPNHSPSRHRSTRLVLQTVANNCNPIRGLHGLARPERSSASRSHRDASTRTGRRHHVVAGESYKLDHGETLRGGR